MENKEFEEIEREYGMNGEVVEKKDDLEKELKRWEK